jgi:hypothetical protein
METITYIHRNEQYMKFKRKLNILVKEGFLTKRYPLEDDEKLELEYYAGSNSTLEIKHFDELKEIRLIRGNLPEAYKSKLEDLIKFHEKQDG